MTVICGDELDMSNTSEVLFRLCANTDPQRACRAEAERRRDSLFIPLRWTSGSKLGINAMKNIPGEGFKHPWPPLIKMESAVKAKVEKLLGSR